MTEQNMKKLYEHYVLTGQLENAKAISDIPRYAEFDPAIKAARIKAEEEAKKKAEEEAKKKAEETKSKEKK